MQRISDAQVLDALQRGQAGQGGAGGRPTAFAPDINEAMLDQVPEQLRLLHYTRRTIPAQYLPSFGFYHDKIGNVDLDGLPESMQRELMFVIWRIVSLGGRVACAPLGLLTRELAETCTRLAEHGGASSSLLERTPAQWRAELRNTWLRRTGAFPNPATFRTILGPLDRACKLLWFAYDQSPWWRREAWDPALDERIPLREHEPQTHAIHWHRIEPTWLRHGAMWYGKVMLETGRLAWSTLHRHHDVLLRFGQFAVDRGITTPLLHDDLEQVRPILLGFLDQVLQERTSAGSRRGNRRSQSSVSSTVSAVRRFYLFMADHRDDAARQTGDPRWELLGPEYARLWRPGDIPRKTRQRFDERHLFSERVLEQIAKHAHLLGEPRAAGGRDDPQAMRLLLLLIATGRRVSELLMLDPEPLIPVATPTGPTGPSRQDGASTEGARVAKLRYQQTKIEGAPNTIFIDQEVVEIIAEQQRWLADHLRANGYDDPPRYLFVKKQNNTRGQAHYTTGRLRQQLQKLVDLVGLTDEDGSPLRLTVTHRFRHTKATSLLNAGVPLHVVQRYIGHTSPEMTMHYAQTLDATAKAEFLRYQKITSRGSTAAMSGDDLYDLMALDTRTDRVLPNGWCTLPPARNCDKGNACLTCDLFVTDRRFLEVHQTELDGLDQLIDQRQQAHQARTGQPMGHNHVWLTLRRREQGALRTIIDTLQTQPDPHGAVGGAGTPSRVDQDLRTTGADR